MEQDTGRPATKPSAFPGIFPWLALAAIAAIGMALQWTGIAGAFLGDDFSHLDVISRLAGQSGLWSWTLARFYEPLGNGTFAYRPLAFATYVLDWLAHRDNAAGWRITSLVLFSLNALAAGTLAGRWLRGRSPRAVLGGMVGGSMLFAYPFAGEVSYWLAGRFDLLACLFSLLFLLALPLFRRSTPGQHLWRLGFLLCALLSKESAVPLPLVATLLVFVCTATEDESGRFDFRRGMHSAAAELWPAWLALGAYLLWRFWLFGSVLKVYPTLALTQDPFELLQRLAGLAAIARGNVGAHFATWACAAALTILAIVFLCIRARSSIPKQLRALMLALQFCTILYLVAPALSFPVSSADGEGARHFYLAWAYASLLLGMLAAWHRAQWPFGLALVALMFAGQAQSLSQWHAAGRQMAEVVAGVDRLAADIGDDQYALLLLPDHIGVAMFARAAQDAIVMTPTQRRNYLPRMAVMVSTDFGEWSSYINGGKIAEIKGLSGFDSANFVGLYCWNATRSSFVPLTSGSMAGDASIWRATATKNFPQAGCITPF
jgi:uncharacterized membrane protein YozB (DUF420 family)